MSVQEKIRVLIVDDIAETRENIRRMLQFDSNIEVVGTARTGKEAIALSQSAKPDVIVMDINMPDMDGITATQEIKKKALSSRLSSSPFKVTQVTCARRCWPAHVTSSPSPL